MTEKIKRVLIVCTGNTARSPVGEYLGKYYSKKYDADLIFESTGFFNAFSYMQPESREFLDSKGIDHSDFYPQVISRTLLDKHDLILTMEVDHANQIKANFSNVPNIDKKTFTLKEFNDEKKNLSIIDPYYTNKSTYKKVMIEIDYHMEKALKKIIELNKQE